MMSADSKFVSPSRRPRILLVGSTGQVGWELARILHELGEVIAPSRRPSPTSPRGLDLHEPASIRACMRQLRPNLVVNAAAYTAVDQAESEFGLAMAVNGIAPGVLAEEAGKCGAALVHYSTDYVFAGTGAEAWQEDAPTGPLNVYGTTKLAGEAAIRAAQVPHLILRVSWVYGVQGGNFVKTMLRLGKERSSLSIVDDQVGAPTSARVIAEATAQILVQAQADFAGCLGERGGTVHLACRGETSWYHFALEIFRLAHARGLPLAVTDISPISSSQYPTPAQRPKNSRLDCTLLAQRFGITSPDWPTALAQCFDEIVAHDRGTGAEQTAAPRMIERNAC